MKKAILILILFAAANISFAQTANKQTITIKTAIYCDHCKKCESCGGRIDKELPFIKGLTDYKFDEKAMTITITYNTTKTTPEQLKQAISKIGFDADDIKADPKAVAKFDGCCKK
jgi:periplasmic mercuric ion binding protein